MFNVNEFKAAIVRKGLTQAKVADALGISSRTLTTKIRKGVFGSDEIDSLVKILELSDPMSIFFAPSVTYKDTGETA